MQPQANATNALEAPVEGLVRTRYTLAVCVVCGHDRIHTPRQPTSCPSCPVCGASGHRSFALFRDLREEQR
jgi:rubrerythrin